MLGLSITMELSSSLTFRIMFFFFSLLAVGTPVTWCPPSNLKVPDNRDSYVSFHFNIHWWTIAAPSHTAKLAIRTIYTHTRTSAPVSGITPIRPAADGCLFPIAVAATITIRLIMILIRICIFSFCTTRKSPVYPVHFLVKKDTVSPEFLCESRLLKL